MMRWVFEMYTYMLNTGDTDEFESVSDPDCGYCKNALDRVASMQASGQYVGGGVMMADDLNATQIGSDGYFTGGANVTRGASTTYEADGRVAASVDHSTEYDVDFALQWSGDAWSIVEVEATQVSAP